MSCQSRVLCLVLNKANGSTHRLIANHKSFGMQRVLPGRVPHEGAGDVPLHIRRGMGVAVQVRAVDSQLSARPVGVLSDVVFPQCHDARFRQRNGPPVPGCPRLVNSRQPPLLWLGLQETASEPRLRSISSHLKSCSSPSRNGASSGVLQLVAAQIYPVGTICLKLNFQVASRRGTRTENWLHDKLVSGMTGSGNQGMPDGTMTLSPCDVLCSMHNGPHSRFDVGLFIRKTRP